MDIFQKEKQLEELERKLKIRRIMLEKEKRKEQREKAYNYFKDDVLASHCLDAFAVLRELRCCDGALTLNEIEHISKNSNIIGYSFLIPENKDDVYMVYNDGEDRLNGLLIPIYQNEDFAKDAIKKVGIERITRMQNIMDGIYER